MTCNCISETNAMLADHNTALVTTMFRQPDVCVVKTDRVAVLRNGKKAAIMLASFCPFCGAKYQNEKTPASPLRDRPGLAERTCRTGG